jgi:hypothetical protein
MSDTSLNLIVQPVETNITLNNTELSVTPTAIDLNFGLTSATGNLTFNVNPTTSNLVITTNKIDIAPSAINMQVYAGGFGITGGNITSVQFNNGGQLAGSNSFTFDKTSNTMSVTNIKVGSYFYANGAPLNLANTYSNSNVGAYLANTGLFTGAVNNLQTPGTNLTTSTAAYSGREAFSRVNNIGAIEGSIRGFTNDGTYVYGCLRNYIVRSTDGQNWTIVHTGSQNFVSMAFNGTYRVAVGGGGALSYSIDGTAWSNNTIGTNPWLQVLVSGTTFLMCGASGIYSSTNPLSWAQRNATAVLDMAVAGSLVVAITATSGVYSNNITTWTAIAASAFTAANSISSNGTTFVVSRSSFIGTFWKSTNGSAWTSFTITVDLTALSGTILYSYSIGAWYLRSTGYGGLIVDVASIDLLSWSYRNVAYLGQEPGVNAISEDYTVGSINLIACSDVTSMRKLPQNLIYTDLATMTTAPVGSYLCLGPVSTNFTQSIYMWLKTT